MTKRDAEKAVVRAAMRLYRHWVAIGRSRGVPNFWFEATHWYPLCSKTQAIPFGKACAALAKLKKGRGK